MAHIAKCIRDSKSIAVIRSYRPIRIERELLAQVFDLAERGQSAGSRAAEGQNIDADQIDAQRTNPSAQRVLIDQCESPPLDQLEAVA